MSVLDLTHTISGEMPVYPGTEKPVLTTACTIETAGYRETLLHMYSHTGTHMDAPAHMIARGRTLDSYGVEKFVGPGFVLDCRGRREIPLSLLRAHEEDIRRALTALDTGDYGAILRAKGIVPTVDGRWLHFDYVPEEHEVRFGTADYTGRLCVIGSNLKEDGLKQLFGL